VPLRGGINDSRYFARSGGGGGGFFGGGGGSFFYFGTRGGKIHGVRIEFFVAYKARRNRGYSPSWPSKEEMGDGAMLPYHFLNFCGERGITISSFLLTDATARKRVALCSGSLRREIDGEEKGNGWSYRSYCAAFEGKEGTTHAASSRAS